jgi:hypothetical protein
MATPVVMLDAGSIIIHYEAWLAAALVDSITITCY